MLDKWYVFDRDQYVGILSYDEDTKDFSFEYKGNSNYTRFAMRRLNADRDKEWFKETLFNRIFPRDRVDGREILRDLGLRVYDEWEIIKKCKLFSIKDCIWMSKEFNPSDFFNWHPYADMKVDIDNWPEVGEW